MSLRIIKSILWREANKTTVTTLDAGYAGQHHVALTTNPDVDAFFDGSAIERSSSQDGTGSEFFRAHIESFDGPGPVPKCELQLTKMGDGTERGEWRITRQRKETAYPLWRPERAFPSHTPGEGSTADGLILIRDAENRLHARWVRRKDVVRIPDVVRHFIEGASGVKVWTNPLFQHPHNSQLVSILTALVHSTNVLLYGPPATGKTRLLGLIKKHFETEVFFDTCEERQPFVDGGQKNRHSTFVTFHESYAYEDFVVGLRPDLSSDKKNLLPLRAMPGAFLEATEFARERGRASLLMIDEINRGNTAKAFGEVITLLDPDKRLDGLGDKGPFTVELRLPYRSDTQPIMVNTQEVPHPYVMPLHVFMVATMNAADKSVAPLDAALRRRFHVEHMTVDFKSMVEGAQVTLPLDSKSVPRTIAGIIVIAARLVMHLNDQLAAALGPDYVFGHGLLSPVVDAVTYRDACDQLARLWRNRLFPQLEEHLIAQPKALLDVLGRGWPAVIEGGRTEQDGRVIAPAVVRPKLHADGVQAVDDILQLIGMRYVDDSPAVSNVDRG
jgi:5-methylcytosine-specific restriction protein B